MNDKIVRGVEIVKANISLPMSFTPRTFPTSASKSEKTTTHTKIKKKK